MGIAEGRKHDSAIQCDGLMSIEKARLTDYVGDLNEENVKALDKALQAALGTL